jgi:hypothetical protein
MFFFLNFYPLLFANGSATFMFFCLTLKMISQVFASTVLPEVSETSLSPLDLWDTCTVLSLVLVWVSGPTTFVRDRPNSTTKEFKSCWLPESLVKSKKGSYLFHLVECADPVCILGAGGSLPISTIRSLLFNVVIFFIIICCFVCILLHLPKVNIISFSLGHEDIKKWAGLGCREKAGGLTVVIIPAER